MSVLFLVFQPSLHSALSLVLDLGSGYKEGELERHWIRSFLGYSAMIAVIFTYPYLNLATWCRSSFQKTTVIFPSCEGTEQDGMCHMTESSDSWHCGYLGAEEQ